VHAQHKEAAARLAQGSTHFTAENVYLFWLAVTARLDNAKLSMEARDLVSMTFMNADDFDKYVSSIPLDTVAVVQVVYRLIRLCGW